MRTIWTGSVNDPIWIRPNWPAHRVCGAFSFRSGGVSDGPYRSLNVGYHVGDRADAVVENRRRCAAAIGAELSDLVIPEQVHGSGVAVVTRDQRGQGALPGSEPIPAVDGLVTAEQGVALAVMAADCVPILMFDTRKSVVAAAHSGWRGTVGHMARSVLLTMREAFHSDPEDVDVWLGPSVRRCCYEVDERVAGPVREEFGARPLLPRLGKPGKYLLGIQQCIAIDLRAEGVPADRIHDVGVCTACHTDVLFSHRAEAGHTGRLFGLVRLVQ